MEKFMEEDDISLQWSQRKTMKEMMKRSKKRNRKEEDMFEK